MNITNTLPARILRGLATPIVFSTRSGHFQSALKRKAVDQNGAAIPMYTYPVVDLLEARDFSAATVLEWGSGQSTLWWSERAQHVTAIERNPQWADYVRSQIKHAEKVDILQCDDESAALAVAQGLRQLFDIIVVDAQPRIAGTQASIPMLKPDGIFIVDNSDLKSLQPIQDILDDAGFGRVDYYGFSPGAYYKQCTSIYSRTMTFWQTGGYIKPCSPRSRDN